MTDSKRAVGLDPQDLQQQRLSLKIRRQYDMVSKVVEILAHFCLLSRCVVTRQQNLLAE